MMLPQPGWWERLSTSCHQPPPTDVRPTPSIKFRGVRSRGNSIDWMDGGMHTSGKGRRRRSHLAVGRVARRNPNAPAGGVWLSGPLNAGR